MGWAFRGGAQSFQQYPLEMHSPRGGGVGEAKPWLSSGSPLDTFLLLPAVNSRAGKFADAPAEQSGRPGCSLASA